MARHMTHRHEPIAAASDRGVVLIEFVLILPLLLLLTFGVIECGWLFTKAGQITNAARHGARIGVRPDATAGDVSTAVATLMNKAGFADGEYTLTPTPTDPDSLAPGEEYSVQIAVPYSNITITNLGGFIFSTAPENIRAEATMVKEGPPE